jgi:hypothetical protein
MSKQSAAPVLSEDVFENETVAGGDTGSAIRLATSYTITIRKAGPTISKASQDILDNDVVNWEAKDFAADETLVIEEVGGGGLFHLSHPNNDKHKVKGVISDGKSGNGNDKLTVTYSVILEDSGGNRTILFPRSGNPFTDSEDEPSLVIDKLGDPPPSPPRRPPQHRS